MTVGTKDVSNEEQLTEALQAAEEGKLALTPLKAKRQEQKDASKVVVAAPAPVVAAKKTKPGSKKKGLGKGKKAGSKGKKGAKGGKGAKGKKADSKGKKGGKVAKKPATASSKGDSSESPKLGENEPRRITFGDGDAGGEPGKLVKTSIKRSSGPRSNSNTSAGILKNAKKETKAAKGAKPKTPKGGKPKSKKAGKSKSNSKASSKKGAKKKKKASKTSAPKVKPATPNSDVSVYEPAVHWSVGIEHKMQIYLLFTATTDSEGKVQDKLAADVEDFLTTYLLKLPSYRNICLIRVRLSPDMYGIGKAISQHTTYRVFNIPLLIRWKGPQRLCMSECMNERLLRLFFENDLHNPKKFATDTDSYLGSIVDLPVQEPANEPVSEPAPVKPPTPKKKPAKKGKGKSPASSKKAGSKGKGTKKGKPAKKAPKKAKK